MADKKEPEADEEEGVFKKAKRFKGALQSAVDRKMQEGADYGFQKGQELESKGYPRLGAAAANAGAGVAAVGSTVAKEGMDYIPESGADAAMIAMGPAGKLAKQGGRMLKIADKAGDAGKAADKVADTGETIIKTKNNSTWETIKSTAQKDRETAAAKGVLKGAGQKGREESMAKIEATLKDQGKNPTEIENIKRAIYKSSLWGPK